MTSFGIERIRNFLIKKTEDLFFSGKTNGINNDILLIKLDKLGDYILFRNFIEETYKLNQTFGRLILCGNIMWRELAEKLDGEFINEFIWIDVPLLENYSYRFSIYKKIRDTKCHQVIHCPYSRTVEGDALALNSGAMEIIGYNGDTTNISAERKRENDAKYTMLVPGTKECMFEFYRNKLFFEYIFRTNMVMDKPYIKTDQLKEKQKNQYIAIFPGAGHKERRWSTANFAGLCCSLRNFKFYQLPVLVCGAKNEKQYGEEIIALLGPFAKNCIGEYSLYETVEVIQKAALVITNDSGPLHLAMALGTPTVCLSNGNHFERFCPYPKEMKLPLIVVLPDEFEIKLKEEKSLNSIRCKGSGMNINLIKPDKVLHAVKSSNFMNYA